MGKERDKGAEMYGLQRLRRISRLVARTLRPKEGWKEETSGFRVRAEKDGFPEGNSPTSRRKRVTDMAGSKLKEKGGGDRGEVRE